MRLAVVDASTALAWYLPDEVHARAALRLLDAFDQGRLQLLAPGLWEYEVLNGVTRAASRGRVTSGTGVATCRRLLGLGIRIIHTLEVELIWRLCVQHSITAYDASYLALAEEYGCECYSVDQRLVRAAANSGLIRWIGEFE